MWKRISIVAATLAVAFSSGAQNIRDAGQANRVATEHTASGVVVLALGTLGSNASFDPEQGGDSQDTDTDSKPLADPLVRTQLEIATIAAKDGQVLLLVSDSRSKTRLVERCNMVQDLCGFIKQGFVRIEVVQHGGPWIRDYGPVFGRTSEGKAVILDARYHDVRAEAQKRAKIEEVQLRRMQLAQQLYVERRVDEMKQQLLDMTGDDNEEESGGQRDNSENDGKSDAGRDPAESVNESAPGDASAQAADELGPDTPASASAEVTEDGAAPAEQEVPPISGKPGRGDERNATARSMLGRLLGLDGATGAVSRVLSSTERQLELFDRLADVYEHVDVNRTDDDEAPYPIALALMKEPDFLVVRPKLDLDGGNLLRSDDGICFTTRVLLSRNPGQESDVTDRLKSAYGCSDVVYLRALPGPVIEHVDMFLLPGVGNKVFLASYDPANPLLAAQWGSMRPVERRMAEEAAVVMMQNQRDLTAKKFDVIPIPSPLPRVEEGEVYYPTVLNGLIQRGRQGTLHVILPRYDNYQDEIQKNARSLIENKFGVAVTIDTVEATVAATRQGAVHCLTIIAPWDMTLFQDANLSQLQTQVLIASDEALRKYKGSASEARLEGRWQFDDGDADDDRHVVFADHRMEMTKPETEPLSFGYDILSRDGAKWNLQLDNDDEQVEITLEWIDEKHVKLIFDEDTVLNLQRPD
jgi:agmatine/peptidylarginine deiminase